MYQQWSVQQFPVAQRFDVWNERISETFFTMVCDRPSRSTRPFTGEIRSIGLDNIALSMVDSSPLHAHRRRSDIAVQEHGQYLVKVQLEGRGAVYQYGREALLEPGDFVLCSSIEPYELHFDLPHRQAVLSIPQPLLKSLVRNPERHLGLRKQASVPVNGLFSRFVRSLDEQMPGLAPEVVGRLEPVVLDLVVTALCHGDAGDDRADIKSEYLRRIRLFIQRNLHDADLTPQRIAQAVGISVRYLHLLFREEGISCCRYLQRQRLAGCRRALGDPALGRLGASEIAFRHGFNDAAHFSRRFKAEYGCTPSEFRRAVHS